MCCSCVFFFFQAEDGIRDLTVTGVQTCALPIFCRFACVGSSSLRLHPRAAQDRSIPSVPAQSCRPIPAGRRPAPHSAENLGGSYTPIPQKSNLENALSTAAWLPSAEPHRSEDPPAADIHRKVDTARAVECEDCNKGFPR